MKVYPNGRCYCGCGEELSDRTAFWVRGHDARAAHRVIGESYGSVADFVVAHDSGGRMAALTELLRRLEQDVFPKGREAGPSFRIPRTSEQWAEMRTLAHEASGIGVTEDCPGALSVLYLAEGLLTEHDKLGGPPSA
jgi:hypothetical protein